MTAYQIRAVGRADLEAVVDLLQEISAFAPAADQLDAVWAAFDGQAHVYGLVAVSTAGMPGTVVGFGSLCVETKIRGGAMGHIEDIVVAPACRGQGIGRAMVEALIEVARQKGCYKVALECRDDKKGFYASLGFGHTGCAMSMIIPRQKTQ